MVCSVAGFQFWRGQHSRFDFQIVSEAFVISSVREGPTLLLDSRRAMDEIVLLCTGRMGTPGLSREK